MLIEIGAALSPANLALAEALAKLGVPLTESNIAEGQAVLAKMPGVSAGAFALAKALDFQTTTSIMKALSAVVDRTANTNNLDLASLDILFLVAQPKNDAGKLAEFIEKLLDRLGQSTENKLLTQPETANTLPVYDPRSGLLNIAQTPGGGQTALAANQYASFVEGQQLLNQASINKHDGRAPIYFAFPLAIDTKEANCELQVWSAAEQKSRDAHGADGEEYLRATVRVNAERLGVIETSFVGMWSGRLMCSIATSKQASQRLLRKESPGLARSLAAIGWSITSIDVTCRPTFHPLWLGGDLLDSPRSRVDQRI
jgi:hypothetical protein